MEKGREKTRDNSQLEWRPRDKAAGEGLKILHLIQVWSERVSLGVDPGQVVGKRARCGKEGEGTKNHIHLGLVPGREASKRPTSSRAENTKILRGLLSGPKPGKRGGGCVQSRDS